MENLIGGFQDILTPVNIAWIALGVTIGYVVGVLPGLGKGTAVAVAIPLTYLHFTACRDRTFNRHCQGQHRG
jgi:putative tricarboxylic transport membrane protein